jgi:exodeoxyribonuclease-1
VLPLARHPRIDNRVIVFDLGQDPAALLRLSPRKSPIACTRRADLPEGEARIALKEIHLNRCPALVAWDHLRDADFARLRIDAAEERTRATAARAGPRWPRKVRQVFSGERDRIRRRRCLAL